MSILDLQGMQFEVEKGPPAGSRQSRGCNVGGSNDSTLSVLCDVLGG
jgi:hypothetical protein